MADYSINAVTRRAVFSGSAGTGPYAFTFEILSQTDLAVYFNAQVLTLTTDYTVTINANGTGSVTIVVGTNVPTTPDADDQIVIVGGRDVERTTDFVTAGDLRAASLNEQLDSQIIMIQQISEESSRGMRAPVYDPALVADGGVVDMTLPAKASRAGKTLAFDSNGNPVVGEDIGNWRGDWAAATSYTVRDLVKDASNYNVYRCNTAHTSSGSTPISSNADSAKWDLVVDAAYAATQATNAAASATAAATSATSAASSATSAASSATTATTKASEASTSATNAATSASSASTSASSASTSATNAATSETNAATSETNAATSETNAASSASTASTAATNAATSETNAASSASTASTAATNAATSETNAATSETNAATSASSASTSATSAASSATAAAASQVSAAASAASAASAFDNFDDTYLGSYSSDPTVDNDGDALVQGALYFNTTANEMRVYDGGNWIAASSAGGASLNTFEYTATAAQTTFSGADDNGATLSYTIDNIIVTLNGVVLDPSDYTATNGTSIVLGSGAALNDELNVVAFKSFTTADMVSATNGGTFGNNITVTGTVTADGLTVDTNTLYVDSTNNRVGIGTTSPAGALDARANSTSRVFINNTGDLIVGSENGGDLLQIIDYGATSESNAVPYMEFSYSASLGGAETRLGYIGYGSGSNSDLFLLNQTSTGNIRFHTNNALAAAIDSNGNVGIGTSSPTEDLDITKPTTVTLHLERTGATSLDITASTAAVGAVYNSSNFHQFQTSGTERMRIDSAGDVQIGTTVDEPGRGNTSTGNNIRASGRIVVNSGGNFSSFGRNNNGAVFVFTRAGNDVGNISVTTSSTSYNTGSDYRLKENVTDVTGAADRVKALNPVRFNFIADPDTTVDGFLAHEVQTVVPEAITGTHNEVDDDGNPVYQGIDQSKLVPLLTAALQEALTKIDDLETRLAALENV